MLRDDRRSSAAAGDGTAVGCPLQPVSRGSPAHRSRQGVAGDAEKVETSIAYLRERSPALHGAATGRVSSDQPRHRRARIINSGFLGPIHSCYPDRGQLIMEQRALDPSRGELIAIRGGGADDAHWSAGRSPTCHGRSSRARPSSIVMAGRTRWLSWAASASSNRPMMASLPAARWMKSTRWTREQPVRCRNGGPGSIGAIQSGAGTRALPAVYAGDSELVNVIGLIP